MGSHAWGITVSLVCLHQMDTIYRMCTIDGICFTIPDMECTKATTLYVFCNANIFVAFTTSWSNSVCLSVCTAGCSWLQYIEMFLWDIFWPPFQCCSFPVAWGEQSDTTVLSGWWQHVAVFYWSRKTDFRSCNGVTLDVTVFLLWIRKPAGCPNYGCLLTEQTD